MKRPFTTRAFWLVLALAGLFGTFTASTTNTLKFNHIPGRIYARAGGTVRSMSQRDHVERTVQRAADDEQTPPLVADIATEPHLTTLLRSEDEQPRPASTALWPPLHLFRPPPALSVA